MMTITKYKAKFRKNLMFYFNFHNIVMMFDKIVKNPV